MDEADKQIIDLKKVLDKVLNDRKSIHAPCKNAYKDSRDGWSPSCPCWRCNPPMR